MNRANVNLKFFSQLPDNACALKLQMPTAIYTFRSTYAS